jgi:hypothetical protein
MVQNGPKWSKMVQNIPIVQYRPSEPIVQHYRHADTPKTGWQQKKHGTQTFKKRIQAKKGQQD